MSFPSLSRTAVVALLACTLASPDCLAVEPAPAKEPAKQFVEVKLWVIEVSQSKLRNLGFDWSLARASAADSRKTMDDEQFLGFITALEQNNLARIHARPQIATQSGRKATLEISPHLKVEVTPTLTDAEHIDLDYHVEVATGREAQPDRGGRRLVSACSTELKSGAAQLLSETTSQQRTAKGESSQTTLLVLVQATIVK